MPVERMDNVAIVVDDLDAAVAFFTECQSPGIVEGSAMRLLGRGAVP
jgi:hypothetical protein